MRYLFPLLFLATTGYALSMPVEPKESTLVVYNNNIGLVEEKKMLHITPRDTTIVYPDVASSIITNSVSLTLPQGVALYSQQYRYDKLTQKKLLQAFIGKKVSYKDTSVKLLALDGSKAIVRTQKGTIITIATADIVVDALPKELLLRPSLVWNINSSIRKRMDVTLDYLIQNIRWNSDYVVQLHKNSADLTGWVTVQNNSGKAFRNTQLYLVAGDVNRAQSPRPVMYRKSGVVLESAPAVEQTAQEGYHIYHIPFNVTLLDKENTQIKFLTKKDLPVSRLYSVRLDNPIYLRSQSKRSVTQYITFKGIDVPLPKGVVRTYSAMKKTSLLVGQSRIAHTPKNTPIKLKLGTNFDLKVVQTPLKHEKNSSFYYADVRYSVQNHSDKAKKVTLLVPFNINKGSSVHTDRSYTMVQGNLVQFVVDVSANSSVSFDVHYQSAK